ncbi:spermatogenesis-associated protein 7 isoform X2 [Callorhinchus milii]|uniref:spermatogenesis-associated protein 7 isoform X2 n=1 Tax=Callorhinchus milii TaxID=7868 RepID=UPI001C3FD57B|nr:spermatogenesis-associated protein 7 isoform X2 [Callorhinchus milii]
MGATSPGEEGFQSAVIPKYSLMGPFKGHMCTKSSPFCSGSSSKLSAQFIIQDHMAMHYSKLLSTKAAVDSSEPESMSASIKYKDQQKREKLKIAVRMYQKEILHLRSTSPINHMSLSPKTGINFSAKEMSFVNRTVSNRETSPSTSGHNVPPKQTSAEFLGPKKETSFSLSPCRSPLPFPSAAAIARDVVQDILHCAPPLRTQYKTSSLRRLVTPFSHPVPSVDQRLMNKPFQDPQKKTFNGDILDKHAECFTEESQPFTPRILKKTAKSFLSKYRFYTAPKKEKVSSELPMTNKGKNAATGIGSYQDKDYEIWHQTQEFKATSWFRKPRKSTTVKTDLIAWENELKYLQFLKEVTDDVLLRGYHSNKFLEKVFERHIERSKHNLSEVRMRNMLQELRNELKAKTKVSCIEPQDCSMGASSLWQSIIHTNSGLNNEPNLVRDDQHGKHVIRTIPEISELDTTEKIYIKPQKINEIEELRNTLSSMLCTPDQNL